MPGKALALALMVALALAPKLQAQELPSQPPTREDLAADARLFVNISRNALDWDEPTEPFRMVGPLYFVGTKGLSSFLFVTSEGHILLNTAMPETGGLIVRSIRKLGFDPQDIAIIINSHAHPDHAGAIAELKELSGAQLAIMEGDVAAIEDGGRSDFHYGADWQVMGFPPARVDRVLRSGDTVTLGDVVLKAYKTPGHTRGSTSWVTQLSDGGKVYTVAFPDGVGINPGYRLVREPSYPGIEGDYRKTHQTLELLQPDIWAAHHTQHFDMERKRQRAETEGVAAWIDTDGYRKFIAGRRSAFEALVNAELGVEQ
ncbi:subclass B3 metallo-beta-lactamase [Rhizobiaceae bacterium n13]|uniref:Subclass B3 metallo-beta-lactamase n=1 Tax=Ferirhizobium litorale TaxID=2927786 RepID=A0AAE3QEB9_9HYPH|nr:subclass B3 metallo-beta-lactamase [Fererhizobium litorale]MDI7861456.1 subclass B3 metallo-beta-lactamase [Fererhizobium litorale]MDI7921603.1 subclass B3 metallo-beta-lactamase [Fererhizobium litorale]